MHSSKSHNSKQQNSQRQSSQRHPQEPGRPKTAVVLAGGGARGAYEVGVMLYIREKLAKNLGYQVPIDILTGTSVGAINASYLAATMDRPAIQAQNLRENWTALSIDDLLGVDFADVLKAGRLIFGRPMDYKSTQGSRHGGILNTTGLERFVARKTPWRNISKNINDGTLQALAVSATHVGTGHTVVFTQTSDATPGWSQDPFVEQKNGRIGPRHVLASAAIPVIFSAVKIGGEYYTDGGLRQNTPMSPAIRLGADRLLVVSLRHISSPEELEVQHKSGTHYPRPLFLLGKALDALMLDHTEYDLDRLKRTNTILEAGTQAFGDQFNDMLNNKLVELQGAPIRPIEAVHIRPSQDIGEMAADFINAGKAHIKNRLLSRFMRKYVQGEDDSHSDIPSYLLFDGDFANDLIDLGYEDAAQQEEQLANLFAVRDTI
ncbi:MAG: patatin-like phospholipase family protein [Pseudomonadales bacterium]|nr:patatin-like phospholipase family protein [Pseudomonadales bacterium]